MDELLQNELLFTLTEQQKVLIDNTTANGVSTCLYYCWNFPGLPETNPDNILQSVKKLLNSYETLKTISDADEGSMYPVQRVLDEINHARLIVRYKTEALPPDEFLQDCREAYAQQHADKTVFIIARANDRPGYLLYLQLLATAADMHSLLKIAVHIQNTISQNIFPAEAQIRYSQYSSWQQETLNSVPDEITEWMQGQLKYTAPLTLIPVQNKNNSRQIHYASSNLEAVPSSVSAMLTQLAAKWNVTNTDIWLAVFACLLHHITDDEVTIVTFNLKGRVYDELEDTIGRIDQNCPLLVSWQFINNTQSLAQLIHKTREEQLAVAEYADRSFLKKLAPGGYPYVLQHLALPNELVNYIAHQDIQAGTQLQLEVLETGNTISTRWTYNNVSFSGAAITLLQNMLTALLQGLLSEPKQSITNKNTLTVSQPPAARVTKEQPMKWETIVEAIYTQYLLNPQYVAIAYKNKQYTYAQLYTEAQQLAGFLITGEGVKPGDIIGVCAGRSPEVVIGVLAILMAGAAFLPIDPSQPNSRMQTILDDASPLLIFTDRVLDTKGSKQLIIKELISLSNQSKIERPLPQLNAQLPAYIIYTSGTTGKPKGCVISHHNLAHYISWCAESYFSGQRAANFAWFTPLSFDLTITSIFSPLASGKCITIIDDTLSIDQTLMQCFDGSANIDTVKLTPSHIDILQTLNLTESPVGVVIAGGEALHPNQVATLFALNTHMDIYNEYGPTEATVGCIVKKINPTDDRITIGNAINRMEAFVLNDEQKPVLPGMSGELYLAGEGLSKGYLNKAELSAEKFIPAIWNTDKLLYRTGDIARVLHTDEIDFLGRIDSQVKIRGYRIELAEIIHHLKNIDTITGAHVLIEQKNNEQQLQVYYSSKSAIADIKQKLQANLPQYMLPEKYFRVKEIPLTVNGKIDERALLSHKLTITENEAVYEAPSGKTEEIIAGLWSNILNTPKISRNDDFFSLGGQSIKAAQLAGRLKKLLQIDLQLKDIFNNPLLFQQAALVNTLQLTKHNAPVVLSPQSDYEASGAQLGIWTAHHLQLQSAAYNMPSAYIIKGNLNIGALVMAFEALMQQHESLRTSFTLKPEGLRQVVHPFSEFSYSFEDWSLLNPDEQKIKETCVKHALQYIDPSQFPLYRAAIYKLNDSESLFLLNLHHIICDGRAIEIIFSQLISYYKQAAADNKAPLVSASAFQYKEFAAWQNNLQKGSLQAESRAYWTQQLKGELTKCPVIAPGKQTINRQYKSATYLKLFNQGSTKRLQAFANERKCGLSAIVIALVEMVLYRYSGQQEWAIGIPVDMIQDEVFENQVGFFLNTIVLRNTIKQHEPADTLVNDIRNLLLEGLAHRHYPFEMLTRDLRGTNDGAADALFNILVNFQESGNKSDFEMEGIRFSKLQDVITDSKVDIAFNFSLIAGEIQLEVDYTTDFYNAEFIAQLTTHLEQIAIELIRQPSQTVAQIPMLLTAENEQLNSFGYLPVNWMNEKETIWSWFEKTASQFLEKTALITEHSEIRYGALKLEAEQLSRYFTHNLQIKPGEIVPVIADRSIKTIQVLLALMRCGAIYLPIECNYPQQRIESILLEVNASVILNAAGKAGKPVNAVDVAAITAEELKKYNGFTLPTPPDASCPAYMIFTSGSTGRPKGVVIPHSGFINMITAQLNGFEISHHDKCLWFSSPAFDASLSEIFLALLSGSTLGIASRSLIQNQYHFINWLKEQQISVATIPPAYLAALPQNELAHLRLLISAGEALLPAVALNFASKLRLFNAYGPTENSVCTTFMEVYPHNIGINIPIGKPIANVMVRVLDSNGQKVPVGVPGELNISGTGLTEGYYKNSTQTEQLFYKQDNQRWYRSGDWVRWTNNGMLEYLGRRDDQIKIRGYRVELGDIKEFLLKQPAVKNTVVCYKTFNNMGPFLVAYVVLENDNTTNINPLRDTMQAGLPDYMVPDHVISVNEICLNSNGKIDFSQLPSPIANEDVAALKTSLTSAETLLINIWKAILQNDAINHDSNFFSAGGQSLSAIQMISQVYRETQVNITFSDIYTSPKIRDLAQVITSKLSEVELTDATINTDDGRWIPCTPMQQKLWADMDLSNGHKYLMPGGLQLTGALNEDLFLKALTIMIDRHAALRYRFSLNENGLGFMPVEQDKSQVIYVDLTGAADVATEIESFIKLKLLQLVNPEEDPLCKLALIKLAGNKWQFAFMLHHLIGDAWSVRLLLTSVLNLYASLIDKTGDELTQASGYGEYALWLSGYTPKAVNRKAIAATSLLKDNIQTNQISEIQTWQQHFKPEAYSALKHLSNTYAISYLPLINGFQMLALMQHTGQPSLSILTPLHGRYQSKWNPTIGLFMNLVPFVITANPDEPVHQLIANIQQQYMSFIEPDNIADYAAQWVPSSYDLGKDKALVELHVDDFDLYYDADKADGNLPGLSISATENEDQFMARKFDLEFHYRLSKDDISVQCMFNARYFSLANIKQHTQRFENMLLLLNEQPSITVSDLFSAIANNEKNTMQAEQTNSIKNFFKKN